MLFFGCARLVQHAQGLRTIKFFLVCSFPGVCKVGVVRILHNVLTTLYHSISLELMDWLLTSSIPISVGALFFL